MLDDASRLLALVCILVASKHDGEIPPSCTPAYFKRLAYLDKTPNFKPLIDCGFLIETLADASNSDTLQASARPEQSRAETDAAPNGAHRRTEEAELYERGKAVLGNNAGGLIARLLKSKGGSIAEARAAIEVASTKQDPREYIGAILRGKVISPTWRKSEGWH